MAIFDKNGGCVAIDHWLDAHTPPDKLAFTGSTEVGYSVAEAAAFGNDE